MYKLSYYLTREAMSHSYKIYDMREGALKKTEIRKNYIFFIAGGILFGIIFSLINVFMPAEYVFTQTEKIVIPAIIIVFSIIIFAAFAYMNVKKKENQAKQMGDMIIQAGFDQKSPKNVEFFDDRMVMTSYYKKYTEYYDEISYVISDKINFTFICRESGIFICVPKDKQNSENLFNIDNLLKEKLGDRFIYDMGGVSNA